MTSSWPHPKDCQRWWKHLNHKRFIKSHKRCDVNFIFAWYSLKYQWCFIGGIDSLFYTIKGNTHKHPRYEIQPSANPGWFHVKNLMFKEQIWTNDLLHSSINASRSVSKSPELTYCYDPWKKLQLLRRALTVNADQTRLTTDSAY